MMYRVIVVQWDDSTKVQYPPTQNILDIRRANDPTSSIISALAWEDDQKEIKYPLEWDLPSEEE